MQKIEYKIDDIYDLVHNTLNQIPLFLSEYTLARDPSKVDLTYEIHMCPYSIQFLIKSLLIANPQAIFLSSALNVFQKLEPTVEGKLVNYYVLSHSVTIYYLRMLERHGLITVTHYEKLDDYEDFDKINRIIGNSPRERYVRLYEMTFSKNRNLSSEDIPMITKLCKVFHIPKQLIEYYEKEGVIYTRFSRDILKSNVVSGTPIKQLKMRFQAKNKNADNFFSSRALKLFVIVPLLGYLTFFMFLT